MDENLGTGTAMWQRDQGSEAPAAGSTALVDPQGKVGGTLLPCYPSHICPLHINLVGLRDKGNGCGIKKMM